MYGTYINKQLLDDDPTVVIKRCFQRTIIQDVPKLSLYIYTLFRDSSGENWVEHKETVDRQISQIVNQDNKIKSKTKNAWEKWMGTLKEKVNDHGE